MAKTHEEFCDGFKELTALYAKYRRDELFLDGPPARSSAAANMRAEREDAARQERSTIVYDDMIGE